MLYIRNRKYFYKIFYPFSFINFFKNLPKLIFFVNTLLKANLNFISWANLLKKVYYKFNFINLYKLRINSTAFRFSKKFNRKFFLVKLKRSKSFYIKKKKFFFKPKFGKKKKLKNPFIYKIFFKNFFFQTIRAHRKTAQYLLDLKIRYQYRLSRVLVRYKKLSFLFFYKNFIYKIKTILRNLNFVYDKSYLNVLFRLNLLYLNGEVLVSTNTSLVVGDCLSFYVSWKYFIFFKKNLSLLTNKKWKYRHEYYLYIKKKKKQHRNIDYWNKKLIWLIKKKFKFIEFDLQTMTLFILYDINIFSFIKYFNNIQIPMNSIRLLNWKFLT